MLLYADKADIGIFETSAIYVEHWIVDKDDQGWDIVAPHPAKQIPAVLVDCDSHAEAMWILRQIEIAIANPNRRNLTVEVDAEFLRGLWVESQRSKMEPDEPEGSFAEDEYIDDLPL